MNTHQTPANTVPKFDGQAHYRCPCGLRLSVNEYHSNYHSATRCTATANARHAFVYHYTNGLAATRGK